MATETLTTALLAADFANMDDDLPVSVTWESKTIAGTRGTRATSFVNGEVGYLAGYQFSVWIPIAGITTLPKPGDRITADGATRQVLSTGDYDGKAVIRLDLGDPYA